MDYTPSLNHMLIITGSDKKQSKIIVNTNQAFQMANLIREYMERILETRERGSVSREVEMVVAGES